MLIFGEKSAIAKVKSFNLGLSIFK